MENTMQIDQKAKSRLALAHLEFSMDYEQYRSLMNDLTTKGLSTSQEQTESLSNYTRLNTSRMRRLEKTIELPSDIEKAFEEFEGSQTWLVITESWCGDAAQVIPLIKKAADLNPNIDLRLIIRDEYPELMDAFLYNGTRSIPILIVIDRRSGEVIGNWGPRPSTARKMVKDFKDAHGKLTDEFKKDLQLWYNKDKGVTTFNDLREFID